MPNYYVKLWGTQSDSYNYRRRGIENKTETYGPYDSYSEAKREADQIKSNHEYTHYEIYDDDDDSDSDFFERMHH